jgi:hypothetical protein
LANEEPKQKGKAYISMMFECCKVYARVYKNKAGDAYVGWCPRCCKQVRVKIGPGGGSNRMFKFG